MSLVDVLEKLASIDEELVAQQEEEVEKLGEVEKVAAEYDAAGRIMARGFLDELNKLAESVATGSVKPEKPPKMPVGMRPPETPTAREKMMTTKSSTGK